jgi:hypothetical protein
MTISYATLSNDPSDLPQLPPISITRIHYSSRGLIPTYHSNDMKYCIIIAYGIYGSKKDTQFNEEDLRT